MATTDPAAGVPQPYIPSLKNLEIFLLGAMWCALTGLAAGVLEIGDAFIAQEQIEWHHVERIIAYGVVMALTGYWRKYQALITPVEVPAESPQKSSTASA